MKKLHASLASNQASAVVEVAGKCELAICVTGSLGGETLTVQFSPAAGVAFADLVVDEDAGAVTFEDARTKRIAFDGPCRVRVKGNGGGSPSGVNVYVDGNAIVLPAGEAA